MSYAGDLHEQHKARRATFFPPKYRRTDTPSEPEPSPAQDIAPEPEPEIPAQHNLDGLIREAQRLACGDISPRSPVKVHDVLRVTAGFYNIKTNDIRSERRTANIVRPRQIAMYLAKELTLRSLIHIGKVFGDRDHTTVLHAVRKITTLRAADSRLDDEIDLIHKRIAEHFEVPA